MNAWIYAVIVIAGYLLGSINVAIMYIKRRYGVDVRTEGSGNAGATNVARTHGLGAGLLTLGSDMLKTALAGFLGWKLGGSTGLAVACAAALTGHCFPVYYGFRGGKGVSASACIALLLDWRFFLLLLALFVVVFLLGRRVSLCSVSAAVAFPWLYLLLHPGWSPAFLVCLYVMVLVVIMHRANIG
ncbi:MAG: glycerol-3-phosphate acyltransferase, partial [Oscillospiraceae bacterium]|nr:glycerol-3-phosphate acyltransferase [Oscillospiraceae bacterium]